MKLVVAWHVHTESSYWQLSPHRRDVHAGTPQMHIQTNYDYSNAAYKASYLWVSLNDNVNMPKMSICCHFLQAQDRHGLLAGNGTIETDILQAACMLQRRCKLEQAVLERSIVLRGV